jgi:hypothetical protein
MLLKMTPLRGEEKLFLIIMLLRKINRHLLNSRQYLRWGYTCKQFDARYG